ncbi:MAG: ADP-ribosylation factor-like protein [Candidatus Hodarchaeales archaeon]|jgi:GTPase SAR1 family protein
MYPWLKEPEAAERLGYKILLAGLSEAGKTAVKRIFFLKQEAKDVSDLSATINYERMTVKIHSTPVTVLDLGGQKIFLKRFLSNFSPFVFSSVKALIFLIDVSNKTSRNSSLSYFNGALEKLQSLSPESHIYVFLHKNDLIRSSPNYESIHYQLKEQFQIESPKKLRFFRTTIFKPETVIDSFGRIFELSMPALAKSELVNERTIGLIEEFAEEHIPRLEEEAEVFEETPRLTPPTITSNDPEDSAALEKLQSLVKGGIKSDSSSPDTSVKKVFALRDAATEEMISETTHTPVEVNADESKIQPESISSEDIPISFQESGEFNRLVSHLINFYGVGMDEATGIVNSGFVNVFEIAARSGLSVPIMIDVLLKYIPYMDSQGLNIKSLTHNRLIEVLLALLSGSIKDDDLIKTLVFAVERPKLSIEEIAQKYLIIPKEKIKEPKVKKKKPREKEESYEFVHVPVPVETESADDILILSDTNGLGFKAQLIEDNASITFYIENRIVGRSMVPSRITVDELMYLLGFEMSLESLGLFEGGTLSISLISRVLHEALRRLREGKPMISSEIAAMSAKLSVAPESKVEEIVKSDLDKVKFIVPLEVKIEDDYLLIPNSEGVAFKIAKVSEEFLLHFTQRGFPVAQATIQKSISIDELIHLMSVKFQLPFESDSTVYSAARVIQSVLMISAEEKPSLPFETVITSPEEKIDETSDELKDILDLLQKR